MILTDTHTHIYLPEMVVERDAIISRANAQSVHRFFLPNIDTDSIKDVFDLADQYPGQCFPMLGLHPCSVKSDFVAQLQQIEQTMNQRKIYAIGEIGIDLYWDKTFLNEQKEAFRTQIRWAILRSLPIVIHCREAFDSIYEILVEEKCPELRGIFHCFTGTLEQAHKVIDLGFYLGIGGVLTYKNAGLDRVIREIDLKHIVLETDSPYLTPVPHRGKQNESAYLIYIAEKLADIYGKTVEEIADCTTHNSKTIFGI